MKSLQGLGVSLSWGGEGPSKGIYFNAFNVIAINLMVSVKFGVHLQANLGLWRLEGTLGLGWWDKEGS